MSKTAKVTENQYKLIQALKERPLSSSDIQELFSCNRQSANNYIKRLEASGCELIRTRKNREVYFSLPENTDADTGNAASETAASYEYLPLTPRNLREFSIIQLLQSHPSTLYGLMRRFFIAGSKQMKKTQAEVDAGLIDESNLSEYDLAHPYTESLLDIKSSEFKKQVDALVQAGELRQNADGTLHPTGRSVPILQSFTRRSLIQFFKQIRMLPPASPYQSQIRSVVRKLSPVMRTFHFDVAPQSNYLTYGREHRVLDQINSWMEKLSKTDYAHHQLRIQYRTRKGTLRTILFQTGLIIYSVEKTKLYLLGQSVDEKRPDAPFQNTVIDLASIEQVTDTDAANQQYRTDYYRQIFNEMFSISLEEPMKVIVRFDDVANIRRKLDYLCAQRSSGNYITLENHQLEYHDTIRGLGDFASYLRQFGKNAHVISPDILKQKMNDSVDKALKRYEETSYEQ